MLPKQHKESLLDSSTAEITETTRKYTSILYICTECYANHTLLCPSTAATVLVVPKQFQHLSMPVWIDDQSGDRLAMAQMLQACKGSGLKAVL